MMIIGLTGGIGTGKSTAAEHIKEKGFYHIDADQVSRDITSDGSPMLDTIAELFGDRVVSVNEAGEKVLDRKALATIVFSDEESLERLNEVMHAEIDRIINGRIRECRPLVEAGQYRGILLDAPLLFEVGANEKCDAVILITADMDERISRVCERDGTDPESVENRIRNQMSDDEKMRYADFVVDNTGGLEELYEKLDDIIEYLC